MAFNDYDQPATTATTDNNAWRSIAGNKWMRECIGRETSFSYNQNVRDGHMELTVEVSFTRSLTTAELARRLRNAWLLSHSSHPTSAIQLSTVSEIPQMMMFEPLQSEADASAWLRETLHIVTDQTVRELVTNNYRRRIPTKGKRGMLFLIPAPFAKPAQPDHHCLVWNMSHAVADAFSVARFLNHLFRTITQVSGHADLMAADVDYAGICDRLPISPITAYQEQYRPTAEQKRQTLDNALRQSELLATKLPQSILMYPETDAATRVHDTHCIQLQYSLAQSQALFTELKRAAATLLAVKQLYAKGHEAGALLGMTRNAKRWVNASGQNGPVPNAADVVFLWIPFQARWFLGFTRETILCLARAIRTELGPHLVSPHYLSSISFTASRDLAAMAAEPGSVAAPSTPGFSPQGAIALERHFTSDTASVQLHNFSHTVRQTNASPWVGMFSLWGCIMLSMGFNTKYYAPATMDVFLALIKQNLASLVPPRFMEETSTKLKL